jgi:hypothetical protein
MQLLSTNNKIIWKPIPNSSQELAVDTRTHHTLYCGSRGPGKTDTQLMCFRKDVGQGYGKFLRGVIFDREYKNLDDLIAKSKRWFYAFDDGAKFKASKGDLSWTWPTGEELLFRVAKSNDDYFNYHGQEFSFIGWNELTKYPTSDLYDQMMSTNRSSFTPEKDTPIRKIRSWNGGPSVNDYGLEPGYEYDTADGKPLRKIPLRVFSTTNPYGAGHIWVKRRFIDPAPYGTIIKTATDILNPKTGKHESVTTTQVAIFGAFFENPYLDPVYVAGLYNTKDVNLRKAWLKGDWNVVAGGMFDDLWNNSIHADLPLFKIPTTWFINRSFDWGSSHPFSVGWWAESNGECAILPDGTEFNPPPGTLIQFAEWYGTKEIGTNKGLKMSAKDIATGIRDRERQMIAEGIINRFPSAGPADNQIRDVREIDVETIEQKMSDQNVNWERSDKSAGSRKIGVQLFRDRLQSSLNREGPGIYFTKNCRSSISTIPVLPSDPDKLDDVDTTAEDHNWDMVRYRVLASNNRNATKIKIGFAR